MYVVHRLQALTRERTFPLYQAWLYVCFVDLQKAYDSVDRRLLLRKVLVR